MARPISLRAWLFFACVATLSADNVEYRRLFAMGARGEEPVVSNVTTLKLQSGDTGDTGWLLQMEATFTRDPPIYGYERRMRVCAHTCTHVGGAGCMASIRVFTSHTRAHTHTHTHARAHTHIHTYRLFSQTYTRREGDESIDIGVLLMEYKGLNPKR